MHTVGKLANLYLLLIRGLQYRLSAGAVVGQALVVLEGQGLISLHFCGFLNRLNGSC